jgi:hypothetical protein
MTKLRAKSQVYHDGTIPHGHARGQGEAGVKDRITGRLISPMERHCKVRLLAPVIRDLVRLVAHWRSASSAAGGLPGPDLGNSAGSVTIGLSESILKRRSFSQTAEQPVEAS